MRVSPLVPMWLVVVLLVLAVLIIAGQTSCDQQTLREHGQQQGATCVLVARRVGDRFPHEECFPWTPTPTTSLTTSQ
jgi:hypothetical protein